MNVRLNSNEFLLCEGGEGEWDSTKNEHKKMEFFIQINTYWNGEFQFSRSLGLIFSLSPQGRWTEWRVSQTPLPFNWKSICFLPSMRRSCYCLSLGGSDTLFCLLLLYSFLPFFLFVFFVPSINAFNLINSYYILTIYLFLLKLLYLFPSSQNLKKQHITNIHPSFFLHSTHSQIISDPCNGGRL